MTSKQAAFAAATVAEAAFLVRHIQAEMLSDGLTKGDKSPVTVGDFAAQAIVAKRLSEAFPAAVLVGEEDADELRTESGAAILAQVTQFVRAVFPEASEQEVCDWIDLGGSEPSESFWTLDPIDGTKGFLRGDQYAVAFGWIRDGKVELGALGCPELANGTTPDKGGAGSLLLAERGNGTHLCSLETARSPEAISDEKNWQQVKVSAISDPTQTRVLRSVEKGHTNLGAIDHLANAMGIAADPVGMDSQAKYAVLASGGGEMLVRLLSPDRPDYREKIWDQAAGSIVIEEAGGRVSDLSGKALDFSHGRTLAENRGVIATNGHLHQAALEALATLAE